MTLLDFRKPHCVVTDSATSHSGKYRVFFGYHWVAGHKCWDVGSINRLTGEIITRHYKEADEATKNAQKADALAFWHEFRERMVARPTYEEENEEFWRDINPFVQNARDRGPKAN